MSVPERYKYATTIIWYQTESIYLIDEKLICIVLRKSKYYFLEYQVINVSATSHNCLFDACEIHYHPFFM